MKKEGSNIYYSSVANEAGGTESRLRTPTMLKEAAVLASPRTLSIESASSSISNAVNSARKIKDRACSFVPKILYSQSTSYTPVTRIKNKTADEMTPVIFYTDEDTVIKRVDQGTTFLDPFSFVEEADSPGAKKGGRDFNSPASVVPVRLFHDDSSASNVASASVMDECNNNSNHNNNREEKNDPFDEVVTFECPILTHDVDINEDTSTADISEAIRSINVMSIKEESNSCRDAIYTKKEAKGKSCEGWRDATVSWDGFTRSPKFISCKWDL